MKGRDQAVRAWSLRLQPAAASDGLWPNFMSTRDAWRMADGAHAGWPIASLATLTLRLRL